jgi:integrase/recombinase XerD
MASSMDRGDRQMNVFKGVFADSLMEFISFKRSMGYKYKTEEVTLASFSRFADVFGCSESVLSKELVEAWCVQRPFESRRSCTNKRVSCIRQYALHQISLGNYAYIPISWNNVRQSDYVPYIFSHEEITEIFRYADAICPHRHSNMHLVMPVLLRLLYSSGLRISEALGIQLKDIDFIQGVIEIKDGKLGKDRLIPMASSTADVLKQYYELVHPKSSQGNYLFVNADNKPYHKATVYVRFREILATANISHLGRGVGPRLHDLRHTFAVHSLQMADKQGTDLNAILPVLSAYLGHESLKATSRYLRLTAEVYPEVLEVVSRVCAYVVPEVTQ